MNNSGLPKWWLVGLLILSGCESDEETIAHYAEYCKPYFALATNRADSLRVGLEVRACAVAVYRAEHPEKTP